MLALAVALCLNVRGEELQKSSKPPWRCYTGVGIDGHSNEFVSVDYEMSEDFVRAHEPESQENGFRWIPLRKETRVTIDLLAIVHGRRLHRVLYSSSEPETPRRGPEAAVFLLDTTPGKLRPFFVLALDESEDFESYVESSSELPFSLSAHTHMSGTGAFYSDYLFSFSKAGPRFLGRTDGGRNLEPKTYK